MENASKALIIAGSILIALLLVSVGIMLFNGSSGMFSAATSKMSDQEKNMFNQEYTMYAGQRVSGSQVSELLRKVIANNNDTETPTVTVNGKEPTSTSSCEGIDQIKTAYQYVVSIDATKGYTNGVVSDISIVTK